jgi:Tol biopolymer transport system component
MGANGENPKRLLAGALGDHFLQIQWSPDGKHITYLKSRSDGTKSETEIQAVPLSGGISSTLFTAPALSSFCWSSDGRVIFSMLEPPPNDRDMNLWEVRPDRSNAKATPPQRITSWAGLSLLDLSISADGKHLVFVNAGLQRDIQLAGLEREGSLEPPRRFTLQGRNNLPSAWTPDGQTLFFYSDRNGNWDIFKQRVLERSAQDFVLGPGDQTEPRLDPDASSVLYWDYGGTETTASTSMRLLRVPIAGGAPLPVLEATRGGSIRCALGHSPCVLSELDKANDELVLSTFNPLRGRIKEVVRLAADPDGSPTWDLSPNGSTVAIVDLDEHKNSIALVELESGSARSMAVGPSSACRG